MKTYLFRVIALEDYEDEYTRELVYWVGGVIGRQTGYLSRSSAVAAGRRSGVRFKVTRSEPVVFLNRAERLQKQIDDLRAELEATRGNVPGMVSLKDAIERLEDR